MSDKDEQSALDRIRLLLPRTEANGASTNEQNAAALHIGRLIMQFPQLLNGFSSFDIPDRLKARKPKPRTKSTREVVFRHSGILNQTNTDVLISVRGTSAWIPRHMIITLDDHYVSMQEWLAQSLGFS